MKEQPKQWLKDLQKVKVATELFWEEHYPKKNWEEKIAYWKQNIEQSILEQEKQNRLPFDCFNANWYISIVEQEPQIDKILTELFKTSWTHYDATTFWDATKNKQD